MKKILLTTIAIISIGVCHGSTQDDQTSKPKATSANKSDILLEEDDNVITYSQSIKERVRLIKETIEESEDNVAEIAAMLDNGQSAEEILANLLREFKLLQRVVKAANANVPLVASQVPQE
ncbi:MAG TPA: hypothetical protein QGF02_01965 [Candidatus Babeliales bacterium]|nr:hypothetical protein [Candidatus Babeliales bacterium]